MPTSYPVAGAALVGATAAMVLWNKKKTPSAKAPQDFLPPAIVADLVEFDAASASKPFCSVCLQVMWKPCVYPCGSAMPHRLCIDCYAKLPFHMCPICGNEPVAQSKKRSRTYDSKENPLTALNTPAKPDPIIIPPSVWQTDVLAREQVKCRACRWWTGTYADFVERHILVCPCARSQLVLNNANAAQAEASSLRSLREDLKSLKTQVHRLTNDVHQIFREPAKRQNSDVETTQTGAVLSYRFTPEELLRPEAYSPLFKAEGQLWSLFIQRHPRSGFFVQPHGGHLHRLKFTLVCAFPSLRGHYKTENCHDWPISSRGNGWGIPIHDWQGLIQKCRQADGGLIVMLHSDGLLPDGDPGARISELSSGSPPPFSPADGEPSASHSLVGSTKGIAPNDDDRSHSADDASLSREEGRGDDDDSTGDPPLTVRGGNFPQAATVPFGKRAVP